MESQNEAVEFSNTDESWLVALNEELSRREEKFESQQNRFQTQSDYCQYYQPAQQQIIGFEENENSYLELGVSPSVRTRCCDGMTRWCPCFRQRRLAVLNLCMSKRARWRQCSDAPLRRLVLICNTLKRLEWETEAEPQDPCFPSLPPPAPISVPEATATTPANYEQTLGDMNCSGRATQFSLNPPDTDTGLDDDLTPINWDYNISITSQTDMEFLNFDELYAELGLSSSESMEWE